MEEVTFNAEGARTKRTSANAAGTSRIVVSLISGTSLVAARMEPCKERKGYWTLSGNVCVYDQTEKVDFNNNLDTARVHINSIDKIEAI